MSNWIQLTGDDIRLMAAEQTAMTGFTPLQDLDSCVASAVSLARSYVEGGGNIMEPTGVPPEVKDDVLVIARYSYLAQDPSGTLLTDIRQKEKADAMAHLRDISKEIATVTQGDIGTATDITSGSWGSANRVVMVTENSPTI